MPMVPYRQQMKYWLLDASTANPIVVGGLNQIEKIMTASKPTRGHRKLFTFIIQR